MQVTITIPPHLEEALNQTNESPEAVILQLLTEKFASSSATPDPTTDPLLKLAGCISTDIADLAQNHDYYLGQALYEEMHRND